MNVFITGDKDTLSLDPNRIYAELDRQKTACEFQEITLSDDTGIQGYAKIWGLRHKIQINYVYPDYQMFGRHATVKLHEKIVEDVDFVLILTRTIPSTKYSGLVDTATRANVPVRLALLK